MTTHRAAVWRTLPALAALAALAFAAGCGRREPDGEAEAPPPPSGELEQIAARVDSLFLSAVSSTRGDSARAAAFAGAEALAREVLRSERPSGGWKRELLQNSLERYGLACEVSDLGELPEPWLLLLRDARRADSPPRALLAYANGGLVRMPFEPFVNDPQTRAWKEESESRLAVLAWERGGAGLRPKAWLFRLPDDPSAAAWQSNFLPAVSEQVLCEGTAQSVRWVAAPDGGPPRIRVTGASRINTLFEECASCPHLESDLQYGIALEQFVLQEQSARRTPYGAFVSFIEALTKGDWAAASGQAANSQVVETARYYRFDRMPSRGRWRAAPGSSARSLDQTYFRGDEGVFRVLMSVRDSSFVVTAIIPTEFVIE